METIINFADSVLPIVDTIEAITQFTQQPIIRKILVIVQQILQTLIKVIGWLAIVLIYWIFMGLQTVYRNWKTALPIAISAFREGYGNKQQESVVVEMPAPLPAQPISRTQQLRQACTTAGIPWQNAKGKNRHLSIREMEAALSQ